MVTKSVIGFWVLSFKNVIPRNKTVITNNFEFFLLYPRPSKVVMHIYIGSESSRFTPTTDHPNLGYLISRTTR